MHLSSSVHSSSTSHSKCFHPKDDQFVLIWDYHYLRKPSQELLAYSSCQKYYQVRIHLPRVCALSMSKIYSWTSKSTLWTPFTRITSQFNSWKWSSSVNFQTCFFPLFLKMVTWFSVRQILLKTPIATMLAKFEFWSPPQI